ncbi:MAG: hypothetical protein ACXAEN_20030 [Candidatus Thorarchaeota archaeon]|jgi:hypothetical protein
MTSKAQFALQAMAVASVIAMVNLLAAFMLFLVSAVVNTFVVASNFMFVEFTIMMMVGACMFAREPLDDTKKYDEEGNPVSSWRMAQTGKKILASSLFVAVFSLLFTFLGSLA